MRMRFPRFLLLVASASAASLIAIIIATASAAAPNSPVDSPGRADPKLRAEVETLNRAMVAAFDKDPATVARFYADSSRIVGPRRETVRGRAAINRYWAGIRKPATWTLEVVEVGGSKDEAYQIGVSRLTSTGRDGQAGTYECDFVVIWKRQADGTLRIMLDLYN